MGPLEPSVPPSLGSPACAGVCDWHRTRPLRRRGLLGPHLPLVLDQPLGVVKEPLFPLPAGSDSRPAGMGVESQNGGPALGGSPFHMGPSSSRTGDSRTLPAVVTYPDVMIAMTVLLTRYGASSVCQPFSTIFAVAGFGPAPGVFGFSGSKRPSLPGRVSGSNRV